MKKSLFSLLILSTLSLSTQAIAQEVNLGTQNISISGRVIQDKLTCTVQPVSAIQLPDAKISSFEQTAAKTFNINFTGCTNENVAKKVKVVFAKKDTDHLVNAGSTSSDTNAQVALFNDENEKIMLSDADVATRTFSSDVEGTTGSLAFSLKYTKPTLGGDITAGAFTSSLSFNAYVADDVK
ncbi:fimbrial protein [Proteus mirabilis]|uniref:fimbrial protein n=1 Tax=Proteus mirabilis TaxID=584 RepID=UPI0020B74AA2|nr:type 1 fimbrial protein [Proteus mirabilis]MDX4948757.1 type 1 fimbrial protein [Proteus mirabilis]